MNLLSVTLLLKRSRRREGPKAKPFLGICVYHHRSYIFLLGLYLELLLFRTVG